MDLFDQMPRLEGKRVLLREMVDSDAEALSELTHTEIVYRYEPTFLYELHYDDAHETIARMRAECFDARKCILLATCFVDKPNEMLGISEIYDYLPEQGQASIGGRLLPRYWRQGVASEIVQLLTRYLIDEVGLRRISTHVMTDNVASAGMMQKNGYHQEGPSFYEDWERGEKVLVNEYVYEACVTNP